VVIHELLHAFGLDRLVPANDEHESEALVESLALLIYLSVLRPTPRSSAFDRLQMERDWMSAQTRYLATHRWTTTTHPTAYYRIKSGLLDSSVLPNLLNWLERASQGSQESETRARSEWRALATLAEQAAKRISSSSPSSISQSCISMQMVSPSNQLSVSPRQLNQ
jgi:hypothetical protein